ncbi:nucleolin 1-like isoform X2 [Raphanus sativus]|uniref:Nucleolin 1-like isoform X2 n=1 Tax=Raphanus sativus TaxID=3726 RepID=A0A9W3BW14_RAPSA|nr:nucleolin 1-like isoform X2 [Raphanus sativus]
MDQSKLKRCSASASSSSHAEAAAEATDPLQKERELETEVDSRKRQKQEEEETAEKKKRCCFGTKDAKGNDERTIFVSGFDNSGSRDEIRSALAKHFSSCGELTRVFVHIECKTGVSRGYAFINLKQRGGGEELEAALTLNGSDLGGRKLLVTMAKSRDEYYGHFNYTGCEICRAMFKDARRRLYKWKRETGDGKFITYSPEVEEKFRLYKKELMASPEFRTSRKMEKSLKKKKKMEKSKTKMEKSKTKDG